jgi:5-methylthioadenosine/S-adenosylhomocysteine deaminase
MRTLITGGTVISMDPATGDLDRGDVRREDDVIVEVAEHIDAPVSVHEAQYLVALT